MWRYYGSVRVEWERWRLVYAAKWCYIKYNVYARSLCGWGWDSQAMISLPSDTSRFFTRLVIHGPIQSVYSDWLCMVPSEHASQAKTLGDSSHVIIHDILLTTRSHDMDCSTTVTWFISVELTTNFLDLNEIPWKWTECIPLFMHLLGHSYRLYSLIGRTSAVPYALACVEGSNTRPHKQRP